MRIRTGLAAAVVLGLTGVTAADAADPLPGQPLDADDAYILTPQHRDNLSWWHGTWTPQTVPGGAHVQVQLPADPGTWVPEAGARCRRSPLGGLVPTEILPLRAHAEMVGESTLPNEGRVPGSSEVAVFDYRMRGTGIAAICLRPDPGAEAPAQKGDPDFVATLLVGVPQLSVP